MLTVERLSTVRNRVEESKQGSGNVPLFFLFGNRRKQGHNKQPVIMIQLVEEPQEQAIPLPVLDAFAAI